MKFNFQELILLGALAASANILGGLILFPKGIQSRFKSSLKYLLALGGGFMLSVNFIEIFPTTISLWQSKEGISDADVFVFPMGLLLAGYLLTQFFEHTVAPHVHLGEEVDREHLIRPFSAYTAIAGLLIHTFFDGVSIAAAAQVDSKVGLMVFLAIFLHKFPEGFTIASLILAAGKGFRQVIIATSLVGLTTIFGVLVFLLIGNNLGFSVAYALPISSGIMLYVAASDLIPEVNHHSGKRPLVSLFVFGGVAIFFLVHYFLHMFLER